MELAGHLMQCQLFIQGEKEHMRFYDEGVPVMEDEKNVSLVEKGAGAVVTNELRFDRNPHILDSITVYYISDIHLEYHIKKSFPNGATAEQEKLLVKKIVSDLLTEEIVIGGRNGIILFGGDTASSFELSRLFYREFVSEWDRLNKAYYNEVKELKKECDRIKKRINAWKKEHTWTKNAARDLLEYSEKRVPTEVKQLISEYRELEQNLFQKEGAFGYETRHEWHAPYKRIFSVIGNHEFWDFSSEKECVQAYQKLFDDCGIFFLYNNWKYIRKSTDPFMNKHNIAIIGGVGFAGYNPTFNANNDIYLGTITRNEEVELTQRWEDFYSRSVIGARKENCLLLILTHNPPSDWTKQKQLDSNCIYFYGHNHRNTLDYFEGTNTYVFADNQIGYESSDIAFKKEKLNAKANPFSFYDDGAHIVTADEYVLYYRYIYIRMSGVKEIEKKVSDGGDFYMIKDKGFYGFFVVQRHGTKKSLPGTYICCGGQLIRISDATDIDYFRNKFSDMIRTYLAIISPYRAVQENIASAVKSFGGSGKIHGSIIDIDFFNHIMLNRNDGELTYYYSPEFGIVKRYNCLANLLQENNKPLFDNYCKKNHDLLMESEAQQETEDYSKGRFVKVDIKNSPYADSRKIEQLQKLFDAKVLRIWDDSIPIIRDSEFLVINPR